MKTLFPVPPSSQKNQHLLAGNAGATAAQFAAFRECYARYRECLEFRGVETQSDLQETVENFILDFELTGKRLLGAGSAAHQLFSLWFVAGEKAESCCRQLRLDRFSLAREVRNLEARLGGAFTQRGLYPVTAYFGSGVKPRNGVSAAPERLAA